MKVDATLFYSLQNKYLTTSYISKVNPIHAIQSHFYNIFILPSHLRLDRASCHQTQMRSKHHTFN